MDYTINLNDNVVNNLKNIVGGGSDSVVYGTRPQILRNSVGKHIDVDALKTLIQSHLPEGVIGEVVYKVVIGLYNNISGSTNSMIEITADGSTSNVTWFTDEVTYDSTYPNNVFDLLDNKKQEIEAYAIGDSSADPWDNNGYGLVAKDIIMYHSDSTYLILTDEEIESIFADND